jgi:hypothetical protein
VRDHALDDIARAGAPVSPSGRIDFVSFSFEGEANRRYLSSDFGVSPFDRKTRVTIYRDETTMRQTLEYYVQAAGSSDVPGDTDVLQLYHEGELLENDDTALLRNLPRSPHFVVKMNPSYLRRPAEPVTFSLRGEINSRYLSSSLRLGPLDENVKITIDRENTTMDQILRWYVSLAGSSNVNRDTAALRLYHGDVALRYDDTASSRNLPQPLHLEVRMKSSCLDGTHTGPGWESDGTSDAVSVDSERLATHYEWLDEDDDDCEVDEYDALGADAAGGKCSGGSGGGPAPSGAGRGPGALEV